MTSRLGPRTTREDLDSRVPMARSECPLISGATSGSQGTCSVTIGDCSTAGLKSDLYGVGVAYDLDKQTFLYVLAAQLKNDPSAIYSNWKGSKPARGADITQIALGMAYRF